MKRILVAYDGGAPARRALDTAIELAKQFDALITVVSVVPFHPGRSPIDPWDDRTVHAKELQEAWAKHPAHSACGSRSVGAGILAAVDSPYDLIFPIRNVKQIRYGVPISRPQTEAGAYRSA